MTAVQVPGIYLEEQKFALNPLRMDTRCLTGFVGISERGPLHTPVFISSFDEYVHIFGAFDTAGHLPFSVYNYFQCGGAECVIVRIANEKEAKRSKIHIPCTNGGAVVLEAKSEGRWGNFISVRVWHEGDPAASVSAVDAQEGAWVALDDEDIAVHDILRLSLCGHQIYRTVTKRDGAACYLDAPVKLLKRLKNPAENIKVEKVFVCITLAYQGERENFLHLSMNEASERYYLTCINSRSRLCTVYGDKPNGIMKPVFAKNAGGGKDGLAEMTAGDFIGYYKGLNQYRGLGALESRDDISLIAVPDISWLNSTAGKTGAEREAAMSAVFTAMINQAERFPGRFAVLDMPSHLEDLGALKWAKRFDSPHAAAYFPSIDVLDPAGMKTVRVPPSGAVCGCIAATDNEKGIFHAPANTLLHGAVGLSARINDTQYELLYPVGINMLKYFPGRGVKIWGARTLSSDPDWRYINVRRTFSAICKSLKQGTQWAVFETNDKNLRKRLVRQVSGFLLDLWMKGYLAGSTAEQGFYVRCDEELNPPENVDNGIICFEVGLAITKPTEFYKIAITAEKEGASVYVQEDWD
jgi:phage tail sheath protein FI